MIWNALIAGLILYLVTSLIISLSDLIPSLYEIITVVFMGLVVIITFIEGGLLMGLIFAAIAILIIVWTNS